MVSEMAGSADAERLAVHVETETFTETFSETEVIKSRDQTYACAVYMRFDPSGQQPSKIGYKIYKS